jgi:hypothetical protein
MSEDGRTTLNGWKEIATYLNVSVRAVQQWEKDRALPVRRVSGARGRVWAEAEELDRWRKGAVLPASEPLSRHAAWPVIAAFAAVAVLTLIGVSAWKSPADVAKVEHDGRQLVATDLEGRVLWSHRFNSVLEQIAVTNRPDGIFVDLDQDGRSEILVENTAKADQVEDNGLFCFNASGRLLWRFHPGRRVRTAQGVFDPPYHITKALPFRNDETGPWRIAVVSIHSIYFPAQVAVIDGNGKLLREYWHAGHLHDIAAGDLDRDGKTELYVVGLSNGHNNAVAIALDPDEMEGAGWEESDDYRFEGMKPGVEIVRWLTPRTPFSRRVHRYNLISTLALTGNHIMAASYEQLHTTELFLCLDFGPRLSRPSWTFCDVYKGGFAKLKAQGLFTTETPESEARGTTGFRDVTYSRLEASARRRTTERAATR